MSLTPFFRHLQVGALLGGVLGGVVWPQEAIPPRSLAALAARWEALACGSPEAAAQARRLRNAPAFADLGSRLSLPGSPVTVAYPASGDHLAPLALCEADRSARPYRFLLGDSDAARARELARGLKELEGEGLLRGLAEETGRRPGETRWKARLGRHPLEVVFRVTAASPLSLVEEEWKGGGRIQAVVVHDWSGDPFENLHMLYGFVRLLRGRAAAPVPLLLLEDLERHPYPVDLTLFSPAARTGLPYGHRGKKEGCEDGEELGTPLFGGAVALSFSDRWWERVSEGDLPWVFDFLWFSLCDEERRNVLRGGGEPLLAPWPADWVSGYGSRSVAGGDVRDLAGFRLTLVRKAVSLESLLSPALRPRWRSLLALYGSALDAVAEGATPGTLGAPKRYREASPEEIPSLREPLERAQALEPLRSRWGQARKQEAEALLQAFPFLRPKGAGEGAGGAASYETLRRAVFEEGENP